MGKHCLQVPGLDRGQEQAGPGSREIGSQAQRLNRNPPQLQNHGDRGANYDKQLADRNQGAQQEDHLEPD